MGALRRRAWYWLAFGLVGGGVALAAALGGERIGDGLDVAIATVAATCAALGLSVALVALLAARGQDRLLAGRGVIARWQVTPAEWDRFRAFDASRATQHPALINDLPMRGGTPGRAVEVIVGRAELLVDGTYHTLRPRGLPELRAVGWLAAPADPECLEFALLYPGDRFGTARRRSLRVPVAPSAREDGVRVYHHFRALIPVRRPGLAYRRPGLVIGGGLGLVLACLAASGVGWLLDARGVGGELPAILMQLGLVVALFPLLVTAIVVLITQPWKP
ncbi:MAG: hypothetical protein KF889_29655 [Alphaproteobacteria bacterium]|nr:hypothetical protein [Alphaproteobacteria bacterium]MCW5738576.1 hypothetical protein [Alphaproteobacteria bacterium]